MTETGYISLLKDPSALHTWDEAHLAQLVSRYPYDQAMQALYLKKLQLNDQEAYMNRLPITAILSHDRKQLQRWSQQKLEQPTQAESLHTHVEETLDEVIEETHDQEEIQEISEALHIEESVVVEEIPEPEVIVEEETTEPEPIPEPEEEVYTEPESVVEPEVEPEPETQSEETVVDETEPAEVLEEELPEPESIGLGLPIIPAAHIEIARKTEEEEPVAEVESAIEEPEEEAPQVVSPDKMSFAAWLQHVKGGEQPEPVVEAQPQPEAQEEEPVDELDKLIRTGSYEAALLKESNQQEEVQEEPQPEETQTGEPQAEEPIDTSKESAEIDELAKKSMTIGDDVVTETLAKIFVIQKKYSKALDAYEKLIVKFPEKEAHFREQMEVIRNK